MKIEINRMNDAFLMEAQNEEGNKVVMDASVNIGGHGIGMRPMQLLLSSLGGCSAIDVISILKKQRQPLKHLKIVITGQREEGVVPSLFKSAHLHFKLYGPLDKDKVEKAIELSLDKYCSVAKTLEKTATISSSYEILH